MFNPRNETHCRRLWRAAEYYYGEISFQRAERQEALKQLVGTHYSQFGADEKVAVNIVEMWRGIYKRKLVPRSPACMVQPTQGFRREELDAEAYAEEIEMNRLIKKLKFKQVISEVVDEALMSFGQLRIGVEDNGDVLDSENGIALGQAVNPYLYPVTLEHWVHDLSAERWMQVTFGGNRSRITLDDAKEEASWDKDVRESLQSRDVSEQVFAEEYRGSELTTRYAETADEFEPHIEYWDFFVPTKRDWDGPGFLVTMPSDGSGRLLNAIEVSRNPYHRLIYNNVPSNTLPLPPIAASVTDISDLVNNLFNKTADQALRQKSLTIAPGAKPEELERVCDSDDGEAIIAGARDIREVRFGGADPATITTIIQAKALLNELAGNLTALGGLGPQSETASQDQMFLAQANERVEDWQETTAEFTQGVFEALADFRHADPLHSLATSKALPGGVDIEIESDELDAFTRTGGRDDFTYEYNPYSQQNTTPQSKLASTIQLAQKVVEAAMMTGNSAFMFDLQKYQQMLARYGNCPDLNGLFTFTPSGVPPPAMGGHGGGTKSPVTNRTYTRKSAPGNQQGAREHEMTMALMGASRSPSSGANARMAG